MYKCYKHVTAHFVQVACGYLSSSSVYKYSELLSAKCNVFVIVVADVRNTYEFAVRKLKHMQPLGRHTVEDRTVCKTEFREMFRVVELD